MSESISKLRNLRIAAGLSLCELARQIEQRPSNVSYWELSGKIPRSDLLIPISKALGVSVEELLGATENKTFSPPAGKLRLAFEAVSKLPHTQQEKVLEVINALLEQQKKPSEK